MTFYSIKIFRQPRNGKISDSNYRIQTFSSPKTSKNTNKNEKTNFYEGIDEFFSHHSELVLSTIFSCSFQLAVFFLITPRQTNTKIVTHWSRYIEIILISSFFFFIFFSPRNNVLRKKYDKDVAVQVHESFHSLLSLSYFQFIFLHVPIY